MCAFVFKHPSLSPIRMFFHNGSTKCMPFQEKWILSPLLKSMFFRILPSPRVWFLQDTVPTKGKGLEPWEEHLHQYFSLVPPPLPGPKHMNTFIKRLLGAIYKCISRLSQNIFNATPPFLHQSTLLFPALPIKRNWGI